MTEDTLSSEIVSPQRVENYETNDDFFQDRADGAIKTWKVGNSSGKYTGVPGQTECVSNVTAAMNPEWMILDTDIAAEAPQVNNKGVPTGKVTVSAFRAGDTRLKAVIDGQEYFCDVHVAAPLINKKEMTLKVNKTAAVSLKNTKLDKISIEWYSTDPAVASVSLDGKIKALSPGTATIYTETGGVRNECVVTVR